MPWAEALPHLERAAGEQVDPAPIRDDSHPQAPGYRAHAEAAFELIRTGGAPERR